MSEHDLSHRFEADSVNRALALVGEKWTMQILRGGHLPRPRDLTA